MKKIFCISALLTIATGLTYAQDTKTDKPKESTPTKLVAPTRATVTTKRIAPETPPTAPPASKTAYYLTSAKLIIETGNDNKEAQSDLRVFLNRRVLNIPHSFQYEVGLYDYYVAVNKQQELKVNSRIELPLNCSVQLPGGISEGWRYYCLNLDVIQDAGIELFIYYSPNFPLDAWKIEKVTLMLEFKDLAGNPHPTMGRVTVPFQHASKLLRKGASDADQTLTLRTDRFLLPQD